MRNMSKKRLKHLNDKYVFYTIKNGLGKGYSNFNQHDLSVHHAWIHDIIMSEHKRYCKKDKDSGAIKL